MAKRRFIKPAVAVAVIAFLAFTFVRWHALAPWQRLDRRFGECDAIAARVGAHLRSTGACIPEQDLVLPDPAMFYVCRGRSFRVGFSIGFDDYYSKDSHDDRWGFDNGLR